MNSKYHLHTHWGVASFPKGKAYVNTLGLTSYTGYGVSGSIRELSTVRELGKTFDYTASRLAWRSCAVIRFFSGPQELQMSAFLVSTGVIALAEIGDKTQLLAFLLATRFKKPIPIILGITVATLINHGLAGAVGSWITNTIDPETLRWILGVSFLAMAVWTLIPDKIEEEETQLATKLGVFGATFITFFLAEMGDKTQIATVAMSAHYGDVLMVVAGTTLGMLIADVPAVFAGDKLSEKIPMKLVHRIAASMFALLGVATLLGVGTDFAF